MLNIALDPDAIDSYGYTSMRSFFESTEALQLSALPHIDFRIQRWPTSAET